MLINTILAFQFFFGLKGDSTKLGNIRVQKLFFPLINFRVFFTKLKFYISNIATSLHGFDKWLIKTSPINAHIFFSGRISLLLTHFT